MTKCFIQEIAKNVEWMLDQDSSQCNFPQKMYKFSWQKLSFKIRIENYILHLPVDYEFDKKSNWSKNNEYHHFIG